MVIFGTRLFGAVDQVPGVFHIATKFIHINFLPLVPLGSLLIFDAKLTGGESLGVNTDVSVKSVFVAWLRAAIIVAAIVTGFATAVFCIEAFSAGPGPRRQRDETFAWVAIGAFPILLALWWLSYRLTRASLRKARYWVEKIGMQNEIGPVVEHVFRNGQATNADWEEPHPNSSPERSRENDVFRLE